MTLITFFLLIKVEVDDYGKGYEKGHNKGYDTRFSDEADIGLFRAAAFWLFVPAALQHGGYHYRRAFFGCKRAGGSGEHRLFEFPDYWILYGRMQRVCDSLSAYVRREGLFGLTAFYGKWRVAVHPVFSGDDSAHNGFLPSDADGNEDSGGR